jgi:divalent metal cation (Fe/Co/Zn/Cd) transporter
VTQHALSFLLGCSAVSLEHNPATSRTIGAALRADAVQSALCAYLSLIALTGLAINAIWHPRWADPIAALAVLPFIVWEGREAMRGKQPGCCSV